MSRKKEVNFSRKYGVFAFLLVIFLSTVFTASALQVSCPTTDYFDEGICSSSFFTDGMLESCTYDECPDGICASNILCLCVDNGVGQRVFASSLPFVPAVFKGTYDNYISYVEHDVPFPVVENHNQNILETYYDPGLLEAGYYDSQCYYEPERHYFISNGQDWFMCSPDAGQMDALGSIMFGPGESPLASTNPGGLQGVVELSINEFTTGGSVIGDGGTDIGQGGYSTIAFVNVVDVNFFDGIYYSTEDAILVNQPSYGSIFEITDVNNAESFQCSDDGSCISSCVLDPDCCDIDMNCSGNPCNPEANGFCDPDCGFGVDPDCAYDVDNQYWMTYYPTTFACSSADNDHLWLQCCPNPNRCMQRSSSIDGYDPISPYLPGDHIATIKEFPCESEFSALDRSQNCALLFGFDTEDGNPVFPLHTDGPSYSWVNGQQSFLDITQSKLNITDWSDYDYLEFYIAYFGNFELDVSIHGMVPSVTREEWPESGVSHTADNEDVVLFGPESVVNYATQPPALKKWLHIKIPLGDENSLLRQSKVLRIELSADKSILDAIGTKVSYYPNVSQLESRQVQTDIPNFFELSNIIALDKVFLSHEDPAENILCSGALPSDTVPSSWISEASFDTNERDYQGIQLDMMACAKIPGYGWTGTQCCGDDQKKNFPDGSFTHETYIDTGSDACLFGNMIRSNTVLDIHVP